MCIALLRRNRCAYGGVGTSVSMAVWRGIVKIQCFCPPVTLKRTLQKKKKTKRHLIAQAIKSHKLAIQLCYFVLLPPTSESKGYMHILVLEDSYLKIACESSFLPAV